MDDSESDASSTLSSDLAEDQSTNVLLGYAVDEPPTEDAISHLGGDPVNPLLLTIRVSGPLVFYLWLKVNC